MNANKAFWGKGDFTLASSMRDSGAALVSKIGVAKGWKSSTSVAVTEPRRCRRHSWARTSPVSASNGRP